MEAGSDFSTIVEMLAGAGFSTIVETCAGGVFEFTPPGKFWTAAALAWRVVRSGAVAATDVAGACVGATGGLLAKLERAAVACSKESNGPRAPIGSATQYAPCWMKIFGMVRFSAGA
jgi:hypothetical protein